MTRPTTVRTLSALFVALVTVPSLILLALPHTAPDSASNPFSLPEAAAGSGTVRAENPMLDERYEFHASLGDDALHLYWGIDGDTLQMAMYGDTEGWVSVGFEPSVRMKDADMVIGWCVDGGGSAVALDCYSTGLYGPHPEDTDLGGTSDVTLTGYAGEDGRTLIEFSRPLATGDEYDHDLPAEGEVDIIWALGAGDSLDSPHTSFGAATIDLGTGEVEEKELVKLWPYHAALMAGGLAMMAAGACIARTQKKKKWWFTGHRLLGVLGPASALAGLAMGYYMVETSTGVHMAVPHAFMGLLTAAFVVAVPLMGYFMGRGGPAGRKLRPVHRWSGRLAIFLMSVNIISGLLMVGVL